MLRLSGAVLRRSACQQQRRFAGDLVKVKDQNKAYIFNELPGQKREGWEIITVFTVVGTIGALWLNANRPDTSISVRHQFLAFANVLDSTACQCNVLALYRS
jgi:hypothetical protein